VATEEQKDQDGWYRFTGMKDKWNETSVLVLEGSATNPKVSITKGEEVELTADQVAAAKGMGARLSAVSDEKVKALEEEKSDDDEEPARGSQQQATAQSGSTPAGQAGKKS